MSTSCDSPIRNLEGYGNQARGRCCQVVYHRISRDVECIRAQGTGARWMYRNICYTMIMRQNRVDISSHMQTALSITSRWGRCLYQHGKQGTALLLVYHSLPYHTDEMSHALTLAAKRGVDVRIITPGIPDKKPIYSVTRSFYNQLVKHGVRIFEWTPGFCHAKMSVADDIMATCGTINLDYRSLYHHFENGCFMADCEVVHEIRDDFIRLFTESAEVTEKYRTGRSARRRLGQSIMRLFAGLL